MIPDSLYRELFMPQMALSELEERDEDEEEAQVFETKVQHIEEGSEKFASIKGGQKEEMKEEEVLESYEDDFEPSSKAPSKEHPK